MYAGASTAARSMRGLLQYHRAFFANNCKCSCLHLHRQKSVAVRSPRNAIIVLHCTPPRSSREERLREEYLLHESNGLAETLGYNVAYSETVRLRKYHPRTFLGKGKAMEMRGIVGHTGASTVFVNTPFLTALQQRNLAELFNVASVRDRMTVILEIFASRARTTEAKLQVELARSKYALSHLIRGAEANYSQQRGGVGFIFGGGEKALELKRRDLRGHIKTLQEKLKVVRRRREEHRKNRSQPTVSLVGYTNVGKSSLMNALTGLDAVSVMNRPFETLDTTTRSLYLPQLGLQSLLIDTVGFISELPLELVASFRATLEEVIAADLLLHVRDASTIGTSLFEAQRASVHRVLAEMGTPQHLSRSVIEVWNKVDVVERHSQGEDDHIIDDEQTQQRRKQEFDRLLYEAKLHMDACPSTTIIPVSAKTGQGLSELKDAIARRLVEGGHVMESNSCTAGIDDDNAHR